MDQNGKYKATIYNRRDYFIFILTADRYRMIHPAVQYFLFLDLQR